MPSRAHALWPVVVSWRQTLFVVTTSLTLLLAALWASAFVEHSSSPPFAASGLAGQTGPATLPASAQGPISATIGAEDSAYRVRSSAGGVLHVVSHPQRLAASFDASGARLRSGPLRADLRLRAAGYGESIRRFERVKPSAAANRVSYARDGLTEWYANGPFGIEQGFTVDRGPTSRESTSLSLSLAVAGNVRVVSDGRRGVLLRTARGRTIRYGALSASDSTGRELPSRIVARDGALLLRVDTAHARFPVTLDPLIAQEERPEPSDEDGEGRFGFAVALSADGATALIGAPGDGGFSGAVWVFTREGSNWKQQGAKLTAPEQPGEVGEAQCANEASQCGFGRSVALSGDGDTALVGAPGADGARGAAWVFTRTGATWSQFGERLTGSDEANGNGSFGRSVALSADGDTALIGAPRDSTLRGAAWTFTRAGTGFVQAGAALSGEGELGGGYFGRAVALSADGTTALIGAPGDGAYLGAVWVYARSDSGWISQGGKLTGGEQELGAGRLGTSVALSAAGDTALIGARTDDNGVGAAWVFARNDSTWLQQGPKLTAQGEIGEGHFGEGATLSANGDKALIGGAHDDASLGAAWTFTRSGASWTQDEQLTSGVDPDQGAFGTGVALSGDGSTSLVGAPRSDRRAGGVWAFLAPPEPPLPPDEAPPPEATPTQADGSTAHVGTGESPVTRSARSGVLGSIASALPPPQLALTGNVVPLSGMVRIRRPGASRFTLLIEGEQIPFGSIVDASHGRVSVTTADAHGGTQTMVFFEGEFKLTQRRDALVVSILFGGNFSGCPSARGRSHGAAANAAKAKHVVRKLWAEGHGSYSTKGSYATGAVLGTRWLTADYCEGTLIRVLTDKVAVRNLVSGRRLTVTAGHSYFAGAKRTR
jgi:hypothetical protein